MGQFEGKRQRMPVQVTREPVETCGCLMWDGTSKGCNCTRQMYQSLFNLLAKLPMLKSGTWKRLNTTDEIYSDLFMWEWSNGSDAFVVTINYGNTSFFLVPGELGLTEKDFQKPIFPEMRDAYSGLKLNPWDVRVWKR